MNSQEQNSRSLLHESFIQQDSSSLPIRLLKKVDIFSFIPVPKDDPVSTRQSLIGTGLFFIIFLTFIIFDFYKFVTDNAPLVQNYYTKLDGQEHTLPKFAVNFVDGQLLNSTQKWDQYFKFLLTQESKNKGDEQKPKVQMDLFIFNQTLTQDIQSINWLDYETTKFYNVLWTSSTDLKAKGLLYSTNNASYAKIKVTLCDNATFQNKCQPLGKINKLCAGGRIFLFLQNVIDQSAFAGADSESSNKFLIYNFFLIPTVYKRVIFNYQVIKTTVQPDFFYRFSSDETTRLQIESYIQQTSNVQAYDAQTKDLLGLQFQLAPQVLNVRVAYSTLLDRIAKWGAFWGVLFAVFAIIFLTYNRKKFYSKNPEWNKFKQNIQVDFNQSNVISSSKK